MALFPLNSLEVSDKIAFITFCIIQSIYTFILFPLSIYYTIKLWKLHQKNILFITKRRPHTVIFGVFLFNFFPVIVRPFTDLPLIWNPASKYYNFYIRLALINMIHLFLFATISRLWLLYYDYNRCLQSLSIQWKKHILHQQNYKSWTLKYKWLGNTKIIYLLAISCWILAMFIILSGTMLTNDNHGIILQTIIVLPAVSIIIIIALKIRGWSDVIYLKRELVLVAIVSTLACLLVIVIVIPFLDIHWNIYVICLNVIMCGWCYCCAFISTYWVIKKYKKQSVATPSSKQLTLEQILSSQKGFRTFADYLVKEFTIEHLFFLFEIMKLKNQLIDSQIINQSDAGILIDMEYNNKLNKNSSQRKSVKDIKQDLMYIVDEYINLESDQSINISARVRQNILKVMEEERVSDIASMELVSTNDEEIKMNAGSSISDKEIDEMGLGYDEQRETHSSVQVIISNVNINIVQYLNKLDAAIEEVTKLLTCDSLTRFYESDQYQRMIKDNKGRTDVAET